MADDGRGTRWLYGPVSDLTLGCGLGYGLLFAVFLIGGTSLGAVLPWIPLISVFTGTPHYGATLLRAYGTRNDRSRYAFFTLWLTLLVLVWFYASLYHALLGSLLLTIYLSWSPWHYSGQNYGIAVMFLRRRGVDLRPGAKRALHLSFFLSFVLALLAIHGSIGAGEYAAVQPYRGGSFQMLRLRIPEPWWQLVFFSVLAVYLGALGTAGASLLRRARAVDLLPTATLVATQALWFSLPPLVRHMGWLGEQLRTDAAYAFFWVATGHTVQYVWITTYYAVGRSGAPRRWAFFLRSLCAGSFIWAVPALLYTWTLEGGGLGGVARGPDVGVLVAAAVNVHHFLLDGAIWKLRDGRVARILIQPVPETPEPIGPGRTRWAGAAVLVTGGLATLAVLLAIGERELRLGPALERGDLAGVHRSLRWLETIDQVGADDYRRAGVVAMDKQSHQAARHYLELSLREHDNPRTWILLGQLENRLGHREAARRSFERALEANPNSPDALYLLGLAWLREDEAERALDYLARAEVLVPDDPRVAASQERARRLLDRKRAARGEPPAGLAAERL